MTSRIDLIISVAARENIRDILEYTETTWGVEQSDAYDMTLNDAFRRIQAFPDIGMVADETRPNVRQHQLEHHLIIYRREPGAVTILSRRQPAPSPPLDSLLAPSQPDRHRTSASIRPGVVRDRRQRHA